MPASAGPASAAACDFQYTGPGCVMLDVAYLLCNSGRAEQLADGKDSELDRVLRRRARARSGAPGRLRTPTGLLPTPTPWRARTASIASPWQTTLAFWRAGAERAAEEPPAYAIEMRSCGVAKEVVALAEGAGGGREAGAGDVSDVEPSDDSGILDAVWLAFPDTE